LTTHARRATAALALGLALVGAGCQGSVADRVVDEVRPVCRTAAEDSSTARCKFDPTVRYDYRHGGWYPTTRETAPTGAYLNAHPTPDE
jgi:hypothetical protein